MGDIEELYKEFQSELNVGINRDTAYPIFLDN
jgi:hypothetical protein